MSLETVGDSRKAWAMGGVEADPDSGEALAKRVVDAGVVTHWLRRGPDGLFNPHSLFHKPGEEKTFSKRKGRELYKWAKVGTEAFECYMRFLRSDNPAHIRQAERL